MTNLGEFFIVDCWLSLLLHIHFFPLISGGSILASKYRSYTLGGFRHAVTALHALLGSRSLNRDHTGA